MKQFRSEWWCAVVILALFFIIAQPAITIAAAACDPWVAKLVSAQGTVEVRRAGQTQWLPARLNDLYCGGDQVQVGERSRADLALINQPVVRLDQNTTISLGGLREQRVSWFDLIRGALYFFSRMPRNLEVRTAFVNAGIEGTEGLIVVESSRTVITIFEGTVLASNPSGSLTLVGGQSAITEQGRPPVLTPVVRPRDAVQWAIYYPPTLYFRAEEFRSGPGWEGAVRNSLEAYKKGDLAAAFESIKGVPDTIGEARFFAYRASLLLTVGRFDQASRDLERALSLNPNYSEALALQAIVAVAQNEKERARELAQQAVTADPNSASALIALSYAQQANFDLDGALATIQRAVQVSPENALAWARLAELQLSFAELKDALDAAEKAVSLDPNLSRTQSVLGFAFLTRVNTDQAKRAFERAIELDQADPLPRLGLGLAKIREGDLEEGRREIEIAVSLDPDNALMRSYLGKAYFEEKRDKQASDQYQMSKQLDPRDPTPYFYDAIRKQTTNRPVEALQDMQRAIELNDNRAVYRSRLLLDADLAARSAALSRIYSDLGFQQLALVEGWKSVNTDPTNFSAHRFLADSYSVLPRHEIARVSELLQSQLLQPLNMTPIQPHLGESNLFLISAGGPAALSFNEFNPLFNRNGFNFQSTGLAGENSTYAGENVLSGIYNKTAFSLGGFHFQTDGWRKNADQQDTIANAFVQFEPTTQTSIQAEFRYRDKKQGDIQQRFFSQDFSRRQQDTAERFSIRFSGRHATSPDSIFVGSFMFQDENAKLRDPFPIPPVASFRINRPEKAHNIELQNLFRHVSLNLTTGLGYFDTNATARTALVLPFPPPIVESFDEDVQHFNAYTYANINLVKNLTITAGASVDNLRGPPSFIRGGNDTRFNPKFGITWTPFLGTSVRAAAFHIVKRTLITDQTLEPTQVAGFAQFFDDLDATKAWRYGVGVDQKITKEIFGGSEFSFRNLRIPVTDDPSLPPTMADGREYLARTYLFWTPNNWLATRIEYNFERFKHELAALPAHVNTHSVPLGLTFFHPSGLSAAVNATYFRQTGNFNRLSIGRSESSSDDFWIVDAALSYRLPNRYGFLRLGVTNLFDKRFRYFEMDLNNSRIQPTRMAVFKIILTLP